MHCSCNRTRRNENHSDSATPWPRWMIFIIIPYSDIQFVPALNVSELNNKRVSIVLEILKKVIDEHTSDSFLRILLTQVSISFHV